LLIDGERIELNAGDEYMIPKGMWHSGQVLAGTRTIHAFGGRRAARVSGRRNSGSVPVSRESTHRAV
jgi:hypothetical protein